jgi:hypothetical protein
MEQKHKSMYTPVEDEVDAIRDNLWERLKNMTPTELDNHYKQQEERLLEEYGIRVEKATPVLLRG